jgi:hypothetical protein
MPADVQIPAAGQVPGGGQGAVSGSSAPGRAASAGAHANPMPPLPRASRQPGRGWSPVPLAGLADSWSPVPMVTLSDWPGQQAATLGAP